MKKIFLIGLIVPTMFLSACGEGWESKLYNGFPYNNIRTAGHGIEYVRENMMPRKGPKVQTLKTEDKVVIKPSDNKKSDKGVLDNVLSSGEKFFRDTQRK